VSKKKNDPVKQNASLTTYRILQNWKLIEPLFQLCTPMANSYRADRLELINRRLAEISAREEVLKKRLEELEQSPEGEVS
jgi:hypothetical protein